ncbi:hypothetical protein O0I10_009158 [Lichtheimia ornata]|uniref:N-acetyltransferase domain-containing protein n=1 Tax=Lichtheimia ornata TaxID=688661 RepID=A0AAD7UXV2_9FUNG|nr:uncharacterized protein O0I10_009158 [Lichtheimia ornata]KAJ8655123.1 hypothetical protein O0I10_009158 [Lichtheimia ornata]
MDFQVLPINVDYASALSNVAKRLFMETYDLNDKPLPAYAEEYLNSSFAIDVQTEELNDTRMFTYMAFEKRGGDDATTPIAYCQLRDHKHENNDVIDDPDALELKRLYIDQRYHGVGIGKRLILQSVAKAKELGKKTIWLYVWENNANAIGFYERQGFHKVGTRHFKLGEFDAVNYIMIKHVE